MWKIGEASRKRLDTCDPRLVRLVEHVYRKAPFDLTVLCGHRGEEEQNEAFKNGASKLRWPNSKHNAEPSRAVDLAPYPVDYEDSVAEKELRAVVIACAKELGIKIRIVSWDLPHFELAE